MERRWIISAAFLFGRATAGLSVCGCYMFSMAAIGVRLSAHSPRRRSKTQAIAVRKNYAGCGLTASILHATGWVCVWSIRFVVGLFCIKKKVNGFRIVFADNRTTLSLNS